MQVTAEYELERHWSLILNVVKSNKWDFNQCVLDGVGTNVLNLIEHKLH